MPPKPTSTFSCNASVLHPTQPALGMEEVTEREQELRSLSPLALSEDLAEHPVPLVRGPGGVLYIVDHHHLARILLDLDKADQLVCGVVADYSDRSLEDFWKTLDQKCWALLKDSSGKSIRYNDIPATVVELPNDPYRTLAWHVRKRGGFCKTNVPFAEFHWAKYFRDAGIQPTQVERALELARSCGTAPEKPLPGCKQENKSCK